jgi:hypothetical protein
MNAIFGDAKIICHQNEAIRFEKAKLDNGLCESASQIEDA